MADDRADLSQEDAEAFILRHLKATPDRFGQYGYGVYLPSLMQAYAQERTGRLPASWGECVSHFRPIAPVFMAAAWELCCRGVLRPGVVRYGGQVTEDGSGGHGYSLTPWGERWLKESGAEGYVPTNPVRFTELLRPFAPLFGPGFFSRSEEAVTCYRFGVHLACCVMCGAAAESILLSLEIARSGDEASVLREYGAANGRGKIERRLTGGLPDHLKDQFSTLFSILKYWRDESGHGRPSAIGEIEAFTALGSLLRTAQFGRTNYAAMTGKRPPAG